MPLGGFELASSDFGLEENASSFQLQKLQGKGHGSNLSVQQ